jgi:DNA (cytosine-5)-methyltransferase 1
MADGSPVARPRKKKLAADLWCGAGGTSTGFARAMRELDLPFTLAAVNHWPTAIDTHRRNHPDHAERTHCADLEVARPIAIVPEGYLDLLMASPTCTFHSRARGGKPVNDQQRMDPWHVVRWCTELRVKRLMVENVPEIMDWGPCSLVTGRPIASRKGEYFHAWINALKAIGFRVDYRILCAADYGDPTTRNRFILIGRSDGGPLRWPTPGYAKAATDDLLNVRSRWRGAVEIIDWTLPGSSIFTRKRPLKPNTIRRILAGAKRYRWPQVYQDALQALLDGREPVLDLPADGEAEPFTVHFRGTAPDQVDRSAHAVADPLPALPAGGNHVGLVMATGAGGVARDVSQPLPTVTAGGDGGARPHFVTPLVMGIGSQQRAKSVDEPLPTITTGGASNEQRPGNARPQFIEPLIVSRMNAEYGRTARPVSEPMPTACARGAGFLAEPLLTSYYGFGNSGSVEDPLPTVTTKDRFGLAEPVVLSTSNSSAAGVPRSVDDPLRTITTAKGGDMAVAAPIVMRGNVGTGREGDMRTADRPLPTITCSVSLALASPFVLPLTHHGDERTHDIESPLPTITGANRGELGLAAPTCTGYRIDILYRMLNYRELARGMSLDDEGQVYDFAGTSTEITKQIGNAVPCRLAKALAKTLMEDL